MNLIDRLLKRGPLPDHTNAEGSLANNGATETSEKQALDKEQISEKASHEIPENIFVEYETPKPKNMDTSETQKEVHDLHSIYRLLEQNLEKKGYEDALMNPDSNYMNENILYIQNETSLLIARAKTYYNGYLRTIDFHIETRKRSGMVETVDELLTHKESVEEEIKTVLSIEEDSKNNTGLCQNIILGYKKGFNNGFAAITFNNVLGRKNQ